MVAAPALEGVRLAIDGLPVLRIAILAVTVGPWFLQHVGGGA